MGEPEPEDARKKKRAEDLMGDYLYEREELREGPHFHVPPVTVKQIEGTKTVYFMPVDAEEAQTPRKMEPRFRAPAAEPPGPSPAMTKESAPSAQKPPPQAPSQVQAMPEPGAAAAPPPAVAPTRAASVTEENAASAPQEPAAPATQQPAAPAPSRPAAPAPAPAKFSAYDYPAKLSLGASRPASFRKPYVKADTYGARRTSLPPLPQRVSAKDLIARMRVVREGVQTRQQALERNAAAGDERADKGPTDAALPEEPAPTVEAEADPAASAVAAGMQTRPASRPEAAPAARPELGQKADGGKLCPSCGTPIAERNRLLICTSCGKINCDACGRYDLTHMKSDVYYEYQFDYPLCLQCYSKAYTIQRSLGKAAVCYGNGNYSYALYYANQALEQDPRSKYAPKAQDLVDKINKAHEAAAARDQEWRLARKHFSRQRSEDPSWR